MLASPIRKKYICNAARPEVSLNLTAFGKPEPLAAIFTDIIISIKMNLNNVKMNVIETAGNGVVNELTIFEFSQNDNIVFATYSGGQILKGYLVGTINQNKLLFSYCQLQTNGRMDNGQSECDILIENGKIKLIEHFTWVSKNGETGINIFQEL
jgi:hypothetical protein